MATPMSLCTELIHALEQYRQGYGDRSSIDRLLAMAQRNTEDTRVFMWQRQRLAALMAQVQAERAGETVATPRPISVPRFITGARPARMPSVATQARASRVVVLRRHRQLGSSRFGSS